MIFFVKVKYRKLCYYKCEISIIYYNKENLDMMRFNIEYIKLWYNKSIIYKLIFILYLANNINPNKNINYKF